MERKNITIRLAQINEGQLLSDLGSRAFFQAFGADNAPEDMAAYLKGAFYTEKQAEELARPGSVFLIVEINGKPGGYAHLHESLVPECVIGNKPVELARFYLLSEWIGKGMGSQLMQACIDEAQGRGGDVLWLGVWEKNARAIAFYNKWGFTVVGTHSFQLGSDLQQDFIMQRPLQRLR
jgi:GNAT superfamily N-acetyltransferase